jgi:hypothetical protein
MSATHGAIARRQAAGDIPRIAALAAVPLLLALLTVGIASAERPTGVTRLDAADAERAGSGIRLVPHAITSSSLVEVQAGAQAQGLSLLAVSADGSQAALADRVAALSGDLTEVHADGSQLRIQLPGLISAGFVAEGSWLAVIDGRGALWRVDAESGRAMPLADGPFIGSPIVEADGSLLLLAVPSVQAPYQSQLVRVVPETGVVTPLSSAELVYAAYPLSDGSLAIVAHEPGRMVVRRLAAEGEEPVADLGADAVNAAVAADGRHIAFERDGQGIFVVEAPGSAARRLGSGTRPCFSTDATAILVRRGAASVVLALDGSVLAVFDGEAAFAASAGCPS